jgi:hypothetical protein
VPHKHLWRLQDANGTLVACDLETLPTNRVRIVVTREGDTLVSESFADKRDALSRSVAIYKEMKASGNFSDAARDQ